MKDAHEVVKVDSSGMPIKVVYCCPSKTVARRIARELRMVSGGRFKVRPCV